MRQENSAGVASVVFSPDRGRILSASYDTTVRVWDTTTDGLEVVLEGHSKRVESVAFSPDYGRIISTSFDKLLRV